MATNRLGTLVFAALAALAAATAACAAPSETEEEEQGAALSENVPKIDPALGVLDWTTLDVLERSGLSFADALGVAGARSADKLGASTLYNSITSLIEADIASTKAADPSADVGMKYAHRLFDARWLHSANVSFSLVGVVNRFDLMPATPGACGVTRLAYRLKYANVRGTSRLPMTVAFLYPQKAGPGGDCRVIADRWAKLPTDSKALAAALLASDGPVANLTRPSVVELNVQEVRWPAAVRPDMGGHTEYMFRMLRPDASGKYAPAPLENTPDLAMSDATKTKLATWIGSHLEEIDASTAVLPDEFLAHKAVAVSPLGLARSANRPFKQLFPKAEELFKSLPLAGYKNIASPAALVRTLDGGTCQGCHQGRALGGFHLLGDAEPNTLALNRIEVGFSPAMLDDLAWRKGALAALARGVASEPKLPCERESGPGGLGAHCSLGKVPGFDHWGCGAGLVCSDISGDAELGVCTSKGAGVGGEQCEALKVSFSSNPHADKVSSASRACTSGLSCVAMKGGFPNGSCSASCPTMGKELDARSICGTTPPAGFNDCIASGKIFTDCMKGGAAVVRRLCTVDLPCEDDYVCTGVPGAAPGRGACMPPYFIIQSRVDGHVVD